MTMPSANPHIHLYESARRVFGGFLLAAVSAIPLGLPIGRVGVLRPMLDPTISLVQPVPVLPRKACPKLGFGQATTRMGD
jgi:ABC-type nitrate/sulfonate/bicarbonate transport system permease component